MVENHSLRGVVVAEPMWWEIKAVEGWVQRKQYGDKSSPQRGGCSGAKMVGNQSLKGVGATEPIWWEIKALEGWVQRSADGGKSKP